MTLTRVDRLNLVGILALGVGLPAILGMLSGAIDVPHNDDFDYRQVALTLWSSGTLEMRGYSVMALVGQVLFVQPFLWVAGGAPWAFAAATAVLAVAGLTSAYVLVRRLLDPGASALAVLAAVVVPGFIVNTTTFMTDIPAFAATFGCLALGAAAIGSDGRISGRLLIAALAVGLFGVSIRESALAAPMAVVLVAAVADVRGPRRLVVAAVIVLAAAAAIHFATAAIPGQGMATFDARDGLARLRLAFSTVALCLGPALIVAIAWWRPRWRVVDVLPGLFVGLFLAWSAVTELARTGRLPGMLIGNLFGLYGPAGPGALLGARPPIYPSQVWLAVQVAAFVATILVPAVVSGAIGSTLRHGGLTLDRVRGWSRSTAGLLVAFVAFTEVGLAVYGYAFTMFDRYLWSIILAASALLLVRPASMAGVVDEPDPEPSAPRPRWRVAGLLGAGLLASLGVLSVMDLLASDALSAARWQLGERAVALGIPAGHIDAGMEWVGFYATQDADPGHGPVRGQMWYTGWWPSFHQCAVVSSSKLISPGYVLAVEDHAAYRQLQPFGSEQPLYLYIVADPACP
jgi:hypothetical protein